MLLRNSHTRSNSTVIFKFRSDRDAAARIANKITSDERLKGALLVTQHRSRWTGVTTILIQHMAAHEIEDFRNDSVKSIVGDHDRSDDGPN